MTVLSSETFGVLFLRLFVFTIAQTAIRLSRGVEPNCSALIKYSVPLCPSASSDGIGLVAGWIEYQMPPVSGVGITPALICTTGGSVPLPCADAAATRPDFEIA